MSGGSLNYLYRKDPDELFCHLDDVQKAEELLLKEGYLDVIKDAMYVD